MKTSLIMCIKIILKRRRVKGKDLPMKLLLTIILKRYCLYSASICALVTGCCIASQKLLATAVGSEAEEEAGQSNKDLTTLISTPQIVDRIFHTSRKSHMTQVIPLDMIP